MSDGLYSTPLWTPRRGTRHYGDAGSSLFVTRSPAIRTLSGVNRSEAFEEQTQSGKKETGVGFFWSRRFSFWAPTLQGKEPTAS